MNADERQLLDLAARVSDGADVDWESAERSAADDDERRAMRHLRLVQSLAEVHRSRDDEAASPEKLLQMTASIDTSQIAAAAAATPQDTLDRWGRLEIREPLGKGSFGKVFRAWDANLQHEVALKLIDPSKLSGGLDEDEILREARLLARLRHPNVITVHAAEIHDGKVGISMELVQGSTLARLLRKQGRFGAREATLIGVDLCRALAAVHGAGLIHRDVKTQNVMRGDGGRILLMDFGAGRDLDELTGSGDRNISGTPLYMAPETILDHESTPRSDLYSLGVLLYRLVTGSYPVRASSVKELAELHRRRDAQLLRDARSDLPEGFIRVVERALAWDPQQRFASAGEMEQALTDALGIEGPTPSRVAARPAPAPESRRGIPRVPMLVIGAMAVVSVSLFGWWMLKDRSIGELVPETTAVAAVGYEIEAGLYRDAGLGRRQRLESGDPLRVGDRLTFEVNGTVPLYVYVFSQDERGAAYALFPIPGRVLQNPLSAGTTHRLPGKDPADDADSWQVSSSGGRERFAVVASPEPLEEVEAELARLPRPRVGSVAMPLPEGTMVRLRGIGGLAASSEAAPAGSAGRLFELAEQLANRPEHVVGNWMRQIELVYPED